METAAAVTLAAPINSEDVMLGTPTATDPAAIDGVPKASDETMLGTETDTAVPATVGMPMLSSEETEGNDTDALELNAGASMVSAETIDGAKIARTFDVSS